MSSAINPDDARRTDQANASETRRTPGSATSSDPAPSSDPATSSDPAPYSDPARSPEAGRAQGDPDLDRTATQPVVAESPTATVDSRTVVQRQREQFGGLKVGCCFFGWLAATGLAVLLGAILAAIGAALGMGNQIDVNQPTANLNTVGLIGGIVLLVIVFVAYYCGGYVAGRMARFHGARQGLGVWLWAVVIGLVLAAIGLIAGTQFDVLARLNGFPRIPVDQGTWTTGGVFLAIGVVVVSLVGAVLGGLSGMRFHRRVDRVSAAA
jgi:hypothetical protein